jgi:glycosyltransferase involved in cell wall biosynthesis
MKIALLTTDNREPHKQYGNPVPWFGTAPEALLQGFAQLPEAEVHVVSCIRQPVKSPEQLAPNINFHSVVVPRIGWMKTLFQGCVRATRRKLREIQPDIVHGQGTEMDCSLSAIFSGFPNIVTIHGNMRLIAALNRERPFSYNWLAARLEGFTLPRTDGVVCITRYTRTAVEALARRTWLLPNAVDGSFFDVQPKPDLAAPPMVLCVGAICFRKNQNAFIRALDPLAAQKKFKVSFLGKAPADDYGREFAELVRERPWCEHIEFSGRDRVKQAFQAATMLVLPTQEDNCPMVVLEAMAAGVPVLASNVGGVPDLINPEQTGLFCDPARPETFRTGVARLLEDGALRQRLATAAKAEARRRFHPLAVARGHLEIYREVLAGRTAG